MKVDAGGYQPTVAAAGDAAVKAEETGYDGWWAVETQIDALVGAAIAAERTTELELGTAIAVAFARNPMTVAQATNDVQSLSGGRFTLGLGSQIKPHITRRFSQEWSRPAPRMREFILAIRAIFACWNEGERLDFRGDFYEHTLMTPFFNPGPNPGGVPKIHLAAVGPLMTEVAGEVADGLIAHGFTTERYLKEQTIPRLLEGRRKAGKDDLDGFELCLPVMAVARDSEQERAGGADFVKMQIGFYGSTPAYKAVLDLHGWGDLQEELHTLTQRDEWGELAKRIPDEVFDEFAIVGTPEEVVDELVRRYGEVAQRITFDLPEGLDPDRRAELFATLRSGVPKPDR